jgi:Uma2 family endonuclease
MSITSDAVAHDPRFPESDGIPLETAWHRDQINFLVELIDSHFEERNDYYAGGNMFIYYDKDEPRKNVGPDVFFIGGGVSRNPDRRIWAVWKENDRRPDLIVELMSPTTKNKDRKTNKAIYEAVLQTPEYFLYDPEAEQLEGWRLVAGRYQPILPNEDGRFWSEQLQLWLGLCGGGYRPRQNAIWVRLFDAEGNLIPSFREREEQRAEYERQQAEFERQRADEQQRRAEAAEAELARLKALLKRSDDDRRNGE